MDGWKAISDRVREADDRVRGVWEIVEGSELWVVDTVKPSNEYALYLRDPEGWWYAHVKWDGCVHLYKFWNTPLPADETPWSDNDAVEYDYFHICSPNEMVSRMDDLRQIADGHFPEGYTGQ